MKIDVHGGTKKINVVLYIGYIVFRRLATDALILGSLKTKWNTDIIPHVRYASGDAKTITRHNFI